MIDVKQSFSSWIVHRNVTVDSGGKNAADAGSRLLYKDHALAAFDRAE